jgi:hypothetical protein
MPDSLNPELKESPQWRIPYEFAVRAVVGVLIFVVVGFFAVGLSYSVRLLEGHVDPYVIGGLKFCEYLLFGSDIALFVLFIVKEVITEVRQAFSSVSAGGAAPPAKPAVESYFEPVRRAVAPPSSFKPLQRAVASKGSRDPVVLSYLALRRSVGYVALALPFMLAIGWWLFGGHVLEISISAYYYTGMRNLLVGSLCAIAMFQLCCRGYDLRDEIAGMFSAVCALGVAFFPTTPPSGGTLHDQWFGTVHYMCAGLLFLTLAYFCLVLFKMTAWDKPPTARKLLRNRVYTACGLVILASIIFIVAFRALRVYFFGDFSVVFCFETTALVAFGVAWLTKGETFLKDELPEPPQRLTTDGHVMASER